MCARCSAPVRWVTVNDGGLVMLDTRPSPVGTVVVVHWGEHPLVEDRGAPALCAGEPFRYRFHSC